MNGASGAAAFWVYLATSPLFWLAATMAAYVAADALATATRRHPAANPILLSILLLVALLLATGTDYPTYFSGAQFVHVLLGPATVALAVPIVRARREIARNLLPLSAALLAGAVTGVASAVALSHAFGLGPDIIASIAAKSVTAPIAMGISSQLGGIPELTAVLVLATGVFGGVVVTPLMNAMHLRNWRARGFAAGLGAHGIGTARALQVHPVAGTFSGLALALNGLATALVAPPLVAWLG